MFNINFIDLILISALVQSFILSVFVIHKYGLSTVTGVISFLLISYSLVLLEMILVDLRVYELYPKLLLVLIGTPFLISPLHYFAAKYLSHQTAVVNYKQLLHFTPFFIFELMILPYLFEPSRELAVFSSGSSTPELPSMLLNWAVMIHAVVYTFLTIGIIRKYSARIKDVFSTTDKIKLDWLRNMVIIFSVSIIMFIIENMLITAEILHNKFALSSIFAGMSVLLMGYFIQLKSEVLLSPVFINEIETAGNSSALIETAAEITAVKKYEKSGLNEEKADYYLTALLHLMDEQKPYLDNSLTLNKLAGMINIPPYHLSELINTKLNQNFFDFINKYRVEKVKQDLLDESKSNLTFFAVALDAGFNSKSSFNMIFKKHTGFTPGEYKKQSSTQN